jgi:hypothetical protein
MESQYFTKMILERTSMRLKSGTLRRILNLCLVGETQDAPDAGTVLPAAIKEHDLAGCG